MLPGINDAMNWVEAEKSELIGLKVDSEEEAYRAYSRYSFIKCFGVRNSNLRKTTKGEVIGREFCCFKQGNKADKGALGKKYTKLDKRNGCKAMVYFTIIDGKYECVRHDMFHNHAFCSPDEVHHLRCHRKVDSNSVKYLMHLRSSGIRLADGIRSLEKEVGGSAVVGFEYGVAATAVKKAMNKKFDGTDCSTLINILKEKAASEDDFYYDFVLDEDNSLVSVFFRDKIMRRDYEAFFELLENDGTYRTNKYDLICAPFVEVNNHTRICMFGIGFMLNERTESFEWLYATFLKSMSGIQPKTVMTDQCQAMTTAITKCFPQSKHRLCVWHLFKNSAAHLRQLKESLGFNKLFSRILKRCHTEEELNHCWNRFGLPETLTVDQAPANGQAEATNKIIKGGITRMIKDNPREWSDLLLDTLWAYRTSKRDAIDFSPYELVYGHEANIPAEVNVRTIRVKEQNSMTTKVYQEAMSIMNLDLDAKRKQALSSLIKQKKLAAESYNKRVRNKSFQVNDLVWKVRLPMGHKDHFYEK
ncbi:hypothetical protein RND81_02G141900 [Saponaria officinalis]|uniref:Protein FAR1-RELATED SEQUENCE n=1 Tax=Saponaria officinalis TaxID=3572 RepID=A0AAW1MX01_SAPOF